MEYAVLDALWELGAASAPEIHDRVGVPRALVYTTTAKVLDRLYAKSLVTRDRVGKSFVYRARPRRETVEKARARATLTSLLGPSPRPAMSALVDVVEAIDPELLDELGRAVAARRKARRGP